MISFIFEDKGFGEKHPKVIGYQDLSVPLTGVVVLNPALTRKCVAVLVNFEDGPFRVRWDGSVGASGIPIDNIVVANASGYLRSSGDEFFFSREEAQRLVVVLAVSLGAVDGMLRVTYYG